MEALARAYVEAVAACCGLICTAPSRDYGIDLFLNAVKLRGPRRVDAGVSLDIQLKTTFRAAVDDTHVRYDLDVKTYNDLRDPRVLRPRILVLLVVPREEAAWLSQTEGGTSLHRCAYWLSLRGQPPPSVKKSVRISVPRHQTFFVGDLRAIMDRVQKGEAL